MPDEYARELLVSDDAFATTLLCLLVDRLGPDEPGAALEALSWHPETLRRELEREYGVEPSPANLDKLLAGCSLLTSDAFWRDEHAFVHLAHALCGNGFDPETFEPASVAECAWAVTEAMLLHPEEDPLSAYSPGVRAYLGHAVREEGFLDAPSVLSGLADLPPAPSPDFTDDPGLFGAVHETQRARGDEVRAAVADNLDALFAQLEALPLRNGGGRGLRGRAAGLLAAARGGR